MNICKYITPVKTYYYWQEKNKYYVGNSRGDWTVKLDEYWGLQTYLFRSLKMENIHNLSSPELIKWSKAKGNI